MKKFINKVVRNPQSFPYAFQDVVDNPTSVMIVQSNYFLSRNIFMKNIKQTCSQWKPLLTHPGFNYYQRGYVLPIVFVLYKVKILYKFNMVDGKWRHHFVDLNEFTVQEHYVLPRNDCQIWFDDLMFDKCSF